MRYTFLLLFVSFSLQCKGNLHSPLRTNTHDSLRQIAVYQTVVLEPSGLAYYPRNNSLLVVSDKKSTIYEIDFKGKVKNQIRAHGQNLEGITLSNNQNAIYLVDETKHLVLKCSLTGKKTSSFKVEISHNKNHSLEGITIDSKDRIIVINEKNPCAILIFENGKEVFRKELGYSLDVSDICCEKHTDIFWVLSDESASLLKFSSTGTLLNKYSLPFNKGEGVAIVKDKIYIINDNNSKLYVFQKPY